MPSIYYIYYDHDFDFKIFFNSLALQVFTDFLYYSFSFYPVYCYFFPIDCFHLITCKHVLFGCTIFLFPPFHLSSTILLQSSAMTFDYFSLTIPLFVLFLVSCICPLPLCFYAFSQYLLLLTPQNIFLRVFLFHISSLSS